MENKKVLTYARLASSEQTDGNPCKSQVNAMKSHCEKQGLQIIAHYEDIGYGGSDFNRPQFQKLLDDLKSKAIQPAILLCEAPYRFSRNEFDTVRMVALLNKYGVKLCFVNVRDSEQNPLQVSILFLLSNYDAQQLGD